MSGATRLEALCVYPKCKDIRKKRGSFFTIKEHVLQHYLGEDKRRRTAHGVGQCLGCHALFTSFVFAREHQRSGCPRKNVELFQRTVEDLEACGSAEMDFQKFLIRNVVVCPHELELANEQIDMIEAYEEQLRAYNGGGGGGTASNTPRYCPNTPEANGYRTPRLGTPQPSRPASPANNGRATTPGLQNDDDENRRPPPAPRSYSPARPSRSAVRSQSPAPTLSRPPTEQQHQRAKRNASPSESAGPHKSRRISGSGGTVRPPRNNSRIGGLMEEIPNVRQRSQSPAARAGCSPMPLKHASRSGSVANATPVDHEEHSPSDDDEPTYMRERGKRTHGPRTGSPAYTSGSSGFTPGGCTPGGGGQTPLSHHSTSTGGRGGSGSEGRASHPTTPMADFSQGRRPSGAAGSIQQDRQSFDGNQRDRRNSGRPSRDDQNTQQPQENGQRNQSNQSNWQNPQPTPYVRSKPATPQNQEYQNGYQQEQTYQGHHQQNQYPGHSQGHSQGYNQRYNQGYNQGHNHAHQQDHHRHGQHHPHRDSGSRSQRSSTPQRNLSPSHSRGQSPAAGPASYQPGPYQQHGGPSGAPQPPVPFPWNFHPNGGTAAAYPPGPYPPTGAPPYGAPPGFPPGFPPGCPPNFGQHGILPPPFPVKGGWNQHPNGQHPTQHIIDRTPQDGNERKAEPRYNASPAAASGPPPSSSYDRPSNSSRTPRDQENRRERSRTPGSRSGRDVEDAYGRGGRNERSGRDAGGSGRNRDGRGGNDDGRRNESSSRWDSNSGNSGRGHEERRNRQEAGGSREGRRDGREERGRNNANARQKSPAPQPAPPPRPASREKRANSYERSPRTSDEED